MSWSHTKVITTRFQKLFFIIISCLSLSGEAKSINNVEDIIAAPEQVISDDEFKLDNPDFTLEKNKKGIFEVPWEVLTEYDLESKKIGKTSRK